MRVVRSLLLAGLLAGLAWFSFFNSASAREVTRVALDSLDSRPARSILFIGNSRTYPHDMPYMVRAMADSAGAPEKYQVRMHAPNGRSFKNHWQNPAVRALIAEGFDDVVLQERSAGHTNPSRSRDFIHYGEALIRHARAHGARPLLFVGWNYGPSVFIGEAPSAEAAYDRQIQDDHARLASLSGAPRANVGRAWRAVRATDTAIRLELDGNHPTLDGAYLTALVIYARLSDSDVERVTYVPPGMSEADARELRRLASVSLRANG